MPRFFNIAGRCDPSKHYMLPAARRLPTVRELVEREAYYVLHAPRQCGKTTSIVALSAELTHEGRYVSAVLSAEVGAPLSTDIGAAEAAILNEWRGKVEGQLPEELRPPPWPDAPPANRIASALRAWARSSPRPLALFIDEIDALQDETLVSVLRQLRSGHGDRPGLFPASIGLVGLRDVRDYLVKAGGSGRIGSASPFNIKEESPQLPAFTRDEVGELYAQHTADTGQLFLPQAVDRAFHWTQGQPWLVNRLARECVMRLVPDRARPIGTAHVDEAAEIVIQARESHIDSLVARLEEDRVRRVVQPMLLGGTTAADVLDDDVAYVLDLGLLVKRGGQALIANPVYREVVPRALSYLQQMQIWQEPAWYVRPDGRLDMPKLMSGFQQFWRKDGHLAAAGFRYTEAGPHLMLMAFLQRILNGGGRIEREYALGRGALDLLVAWKDERFAIEVKLRRDRSTLRDGVEKTVRYLDAVGLSEGWLVLFDLRKLAWDRKVFNRRVRSGGKIVHVVGV